MAISLTPPQRLVVCVCGIYFFYLYYGILQEQLFRVGEADGSKFQATFFLMFIQCFVNFIVAVAMRTVVGGSKLSKPLGEVAKTSPFPFAPSGYAWIAAISLSYLLAMSASTQALMFVSYAFQALAKSCKMIPVMLGNVLIGSKKYSLKEYCVVFVITAGVAMFNLGKKKGKQDDASSFLGLVLLFISLTLDGFTSSNQRLFADEYKPTTHTLMMQMNLWSLIFLVPLLWFTGQGVEGFDYFMSHPVFQYRALMFALCSAMGQNFIFYTITGPGPLACTTITTTRKFFTILASVLLYPENSLNQQQWLSVVLVFAGLSIELQDKYAKHANKQKLQ